MRSTSAFHRNPFDTSHIFLVLCGVVFAIFLFQTYEMEEASSYRLPRLVSGFGLFVGSLKLILTFLKRRSPDTGSEEEGEAKGLHVAYSVVFATVYFLATRWLGFMVSTAVAILVFSYLMSFPRKKLAVLLAIVIPLALHLVFVTLLQASLPAGIVENLFF